MTTRAPSPASLLDPDEGIRRNATLEALAGLPPAQTCEPETAPDITAGNSSQMTDGAAAMLIAERSVAEKLGLPIRARFHAFAVAAEDAAIVLSAPVPATRKLLERTGMKIDDFDAIECNEAFAAIALMWPRAFSPDPDLLNPAAGPSPSATPSAPAGSGSDGRCSTSSRPPAAATASRPCARAAARPTPPSSSGSPELAAPGRRRSPQPRSLYEEGKENDSVSDGGEKVTVGGLAREVSLPDRLSAYGDGADGGGGRHHPYSSLKHPR